MLKRQSVLAPVGSALGPQTQPSSQPAALWPLRETVAILLIVASIALISVGVTAWLGWPIAATITGVIVGFIGVMLGVSK